MFRLLDVRPSLHMRLRSDINVSPPCHAGAIREELDPRVVPVQLYCKTPPKRRLRPGAGPLFAVRPDTLTMEGAFQRNRRGKWLYEYMYVDAAPGLSMNRYDLI